eukprot:scaffold2645_cov378-Prasinococcus_capsulatus_cf.AAC.23
MGPPGGGRNPVTNRYLRHFNFLSFSEVSDDSLLRIFGLILSSHLQHFSKDVRRISTSVIRSTMDIYRTLREELLPTPSKCHYTFNLRDFAKVVQGLLRADKEHVTTASDLVLLWLHECTRVFCDRLVNTEDREWFLQLQKQQLSATCKLSYQEVMSADRLIYGDYLIPGADPSVYEQITDMSRLLSTMEEYLEDYNTESNSPMNLVLFLDAIEHVSRICRVIRLPLGNALLLGVGGSGRQSLTRLATYIEGYELFQIEVAKGYGVTEWKDDLRKVLLMAGAEMRDVVFLFSDTQIVQESFLEDLNNILNSGGVPNLMGHEELEIIASAVRPSLQAEGLPATKNAIYSTFLQRVRSKIHLVICLSPVGDVFSHRLRMFPSLVNCCTIDWFSAWPDEALTCVASSKYSHDLEDDTLRSKVVQASVFVHQSVERASQRFYEQLQRYNYVTPTSYLELLSTFSKLLETKKLKLETTRRRLKAGLGKLMTTSKEVESMQADLRSLQPVLEKTQKEAEEMEAAIAKDKEEADRTKVIVVQQEDEAKFQAAEAKSIADDAERDLAQALPALDEALESLKQLSRNDIVEVKSLRNPPEGRNMSRYAHGHTTT